MKTIKILSTSLIFFALMAFTGKKLHVDVYNVDTKQSSMEWFAEKITGKHNGTIKISGGQLKNDHGNFTGTFEIDMTSIENKDIDPGSKRTNLENHLKSEDFFHVEKFPKSIFKVTSITPVNDPGKGGLTHSVRGLLTIKDKTNELVFNAAIKMDENKISCTGSAVVDRSKYDVKYGSKSFFPEIGDKMIYDEFTLKFAMVAVK